jgi:(5-formylfuran-3-yl)methyl phosphate synthase
MTIQLLVSVRNAQEAVIAADSGADIVDVKEPDRGSLGFAGAATVRDVVDAVADRMPVSAALGECLDWSMENRDMNALRFDGMEQSLSFVKMGLARLHSTAAGNEWVSRWIENRAEFDSCLRSETVVGSADNSRSAAQPMAAASCDIGSQRRGPDWVAVAYADHERAGAPPWREVLEAAQSSGCAFLLIDTYGKDGSNTLDWLSQSELVNVRQHCRRSQLSFALAGQLNQAHLPTIRLIQPDILAVRGAVCDGLDRCSTVSAEKVGQLKTALH